MSVPPPPKYYEGRNLETEFIESLEDPKAFNELTKDGKQQCLLGIQAKILDISFLFNTYGTGVDQHRVIYSFYGDLCMALEDNFNISPQHAEMCWKVAVVFFRICTFNTARFFSGVEVPILMMAKYCPGVLWRIITLHNTPDCPLWVDLMAERAQKQFREAMDGAVTVDEKETVDYIKGMLVEFFNEEELDLPDASICEWLGLDSE
jgi:hypothetical protein